MYPSTYAQRHLPSISTVPGEPPATSPKGACRSADHFSLEVGTRTAGSKLSCSPSSERAFEALHDLSVRPLPLLSFCLECSFLSLFWFRLKSNLLRHAFSDQLRSLSLSSGSLSHYHDRMSLFDLSLSEITLHICLLVSLLSVSRILNSRRAGPCLFC